MHQYKFFSVAVTTTLFVILLLFQPAANALVTYNYVGNNFTEYEGDNYDQDNYISVNLSFDSALSANSSYTDADSLPGYFLSIADGHQVYSSTVIESQTVNLITDSSGNIIRWYIFMDIAFGNDIMLYTMNYLPGDWGWEGPSAADGGRESYDPSSFGRVFNNPGTWTSNAAVPEPTTIILLGLGLIGLAGLRRK